MPRSRPIPIWRRRSHVPVPDDFKQAIEEVKLRVPIEEIVRERVAGLRKSGALWEACCPFHEERTPSFKVNPGRGTWHCFGACGRGGDVLSFVQEFEQLEFLEALEILAARVGVELPSRNRRDGGGSQQERGRFKELYELLERARSFYGRALRSAEGQRALEYLRERGFEDATLEAFGVGYAPASGRALVEKLRANDVPLERALEAGLARRSTEPQGGEGRAYDFFRGRLMVPIRDMRGRTVGFGARRLDDDPHSPKYINTAETPLFRKAQLIYGLDHALDHVRKNGHLILVEGYTDVMAAHQVGLRSVVAVLGTSTTDEHAGLVRRTGARRVTLCFDGDEAGALASMRALRGLLPLEVDLDVARLEDGFDPCDRLLRDGAQALTVLCENAQGWLDFALGRLDAVEGRAYWERLDQVFELVARQRRPLERDATLARIASVLGSPADSVRAQFEDLPARRRERARIQREQAAAESPPAAQELVHSGPLEPADPLDPAERSAWREVVGALLLDSALAVHLGERACPDPELQEICACVLRLREQAQGAQVGVDSIMTELGDHPARDWVVPLVEEAEVADDPSTLMSGALAYLDRRQEQLRIQRQVASLPPGGDALHHSLAQLHEQLRRCKDSVGVRT